MVKKAKAIELLNRQIAGGKQLLQSQGDTEKWKLDNAAVLDQVFGSKSRQFNQLRNIHWYPMIVGGVGSFGNGQQALEGTRKAAVQSSIVVLTSARDEVNDIWDDDQSAGKVDPFHRIERICNRFHNIVRQLRDRHDSRPTLDVSDEYDVQDLLHALLLLDFEDVRPEEWTPSYAGASSRMDFLLKRQQIVLEAKKTRKGLGAKEVGEQLIVDCQRYQAHPDCKMLVCFVYDSEGLVANPRGLENDLSTAGGNMPVRIFISAIAVKAARNPEQLDLKQANISRNLAA